MNTQNSDEVDEFPGCPRCKGREVGAPGEPIYGIRNALLAVRGWAFDVREAAANVVKAQNESPERMKRAVDRLSAVLGEVEAKERAS